MEKEISKQVELMDDLIRLLKEVDKIEAKTIECVKERKQTVTKTESGAKLVVVLVMALVALGCQGSEVPAYGGGSGGYGGGEAVSVSQEDADLDPDCNLSNMKRNGNSYFDSMRTEYQCYYIKDYVEVIYIEMAFFHDMSGYQNSGVKAFEFTEWQLQTNQCRIVNYDGGVLQFKISHATLDSQYRMKKALLHDHESRVYDLTCDYVLGPLN